MQSKGVIKFFAIAFAIVCLFQLSFTFFSKKVESNAEQYANNDESKRIAEQAAKNRDVQFKVIFDSVQKAREQYYLDSMKNETVYNILVREYTFQEVKERELNLGLDLKGGMNVTLEIEVSEIVEALADNSDDPRFREALQTARQKQRTSQEDFVTLFAESWNEVAPDGKLAVIFNTMELKDKISYDSSNEEVISVIRTEVNSAIDRAYNILRTRIDRFGVAQPNIQRLQTTGRILVELPGIKEPQRVRKLLQGTAKLEFWETYKFNEINQYFEEANRKLRTMVETEPELEEAARDTVPMEDEGETQLEKPGDAEAGDTLEETAQDTTEESLEELLESDTAAGEMTEDQEKAFEEYAKQNPLYAYLRPAYYQQQGQYYASESSAVGYAEIKDTARVNMLLDKVDKVFPPDLKLAWEVKPQKGQEGVLGLVALRITSRNNTAPLTGDVIVNARQDYDQNGRVVVSMSMNSEGTRIWRRLTADNIGNQIAIVLDGYVYSAPRVNDEIPSGRSQISGNFTVEEAKDLANILEAGKLPAPANIVQEEVVGPSLGREAIQSGFNSFILAFVLVLIFMVFYYNHAGWIANLALITNIFFVLGVLASLGAVLTLPGIAGIILTIGMAVDANVIIYERIKEEIRAGKGARLAITDGYKNAYSAIVDANITTLLVGIVLYTFGSGPVQGFATTLIIGILSSLFTAIFISRLIFNWLLNKEIDVKLGNKMTLNAFTGINVDFIGKRKTFYIISSLVVLLGIASLLMKGLNPGVDFAGGRTYIVRFDNDVNTVDVRNSLEQQFEEAPEVKTFGPSSQIKVTTKYLINEEGASADSLVERKLYEGVKTYYDEPVSYQQFNSETEDKTVGKLSSQKVGPTIADDLLRKAYFALGFALVIIFVYIAARFRKWQYGIGGVATLIHDSIITVSLYSIFHGILPFSMEVDQSFIAAILTIIGYSINDSVIIFDRIREYNFLYPKRHLKININAGINSTLGRTFMTSGTTFLVLLMIFLFGGEVIRGFSFALMIGVIVGTYSSIFVSTPVSYELTGYKEAAKKVVTKSKGAKGKQAPKGKQPAKAKKK
ncbi:MAG: protein translocase subunit SecDF [Bacteroidales bacterium]|nr:protein translocase subunit SecDF [Bacteroidales bacterium]